MGLLNESNQILLPDYINSTLRLFNLNGEVEKIIHVKGLWYPKAICIDRNKQILISNADNIIVLNEKFQLLRKILNESCEYIISDAENPSYAYTSSYVTNKLKIINMQNFEIIKEIEIDSPFHMMLKLNKLYVISATHLDFEEDDNLKIFKKVKSGGNCIFVVNKMNLEIIKVIKLENWMSPLSIFVDDNENLITTALKLNNKTELSCFRYLIIINFCGEVIHEIYLDGIENFLDAISIGKNLIFCGFEKKDIKYKSFWLKKIKIE